MRIITRIHDWETRRAALSHQIISNQIAPAASKLLSVLEGRVHDPEFVEEFVGNLLPQLDAVSDDVKWLVENSQSSLSPRRLFELPPLMRVEGDTFKWLPDVADCLWAERVELASTLRKASILLDRLLNAAELLVAKASNTSSKELCAHAEGFQVELRKLSSHISKIGRAHV